jgi:hypothetical protein
MIAISLWKVGRDPLAADGSQQKTYVATFTRNAEGEWPAVGRACAEGHAAQKLSFLQRSNPYIEQTSIDYYVAGDVLTCTLVVKVKPNPHLLTVEQTLGREGTTLEEWMGSAEAHDSVMPACCDEGCTVEPDGRCEHGCPSIALSLGVI